MNLPSSVLQFSGVVYLRRDEYELENYSFESSLVGAFSCRIYIFVSFFPPSFFLSLGSEMLKCAFGFSHLPLHYRS